MPRFISKLLGAPGLTTRSKDATSGSWGPGIATRNKEATRGFISFEQKVLKPGGK